jgi:DNA mismatch endonuclease (patch repair protein)
MSKRMADIFTSKKRSEIMSKVRSKNTKPEETVRKFLFANGFRYRKNVKELPGKPDIVLPKYKTVIFVNGCFWHGHDCPKGKLPSTNESFWREKIGGNVKRDLKNYDLLKQRGWNVIIVWECEINSKSAKEERLKRLKSEICQNEIK